MKPGEKLNEEAVYEDCLNIDTDDTNITYPWDDDWSDVPLQNETSSTQEDLDKYIGSQIVLHDENGQEVLCRVKGRKRTSNGDAVGQYNPNPILDTRLFDVEYPDGRVEAYATNAIAEPCIVTWMTKVSLLVYSMKLLIMRKQMRQYQWRKVLQVTTTMFQLLLQKVGKLRSSGVMAATTGCP